MFEIMKKEICQSLYQMDDELIEGLSLDHAQEM